MKVLYIVRATVGKEGSSKDHCKKVVSRILGIDEEDAESEFSYGCAVNGMWYSDVSVQRVIK
jgi:hypothetical protein